MTGRPPPFATKFIDDFNRRFAKAPHSERDAHRRLLDYDNLGDICQWREERKVSKQLSINYKRVMYLLEPREHVKKLKGKRVQVHEDEAGTVETRSRAVVLPAKRFERVPGALNGAVVENKLLSGALLHIQNEQRRRDALLAAKGKLTKRDKRLLAERRFFQARLLTPHAAE